MGITTIWDILHWFPRAYIDASLPRPLALVKPGEVVAVSATIDRVELGRTKQRGMTVLRALLSDDSGQLQAQWFNQPYLKDKVQVGSEWTMVGQIGFFQGKKILQNPFLLQQPEVIPRYRQSASVSSRQLQSLVRACLPSAEAIPDVLPEAVRQTEGLLTVHKAFATIHQPESLQEAEVARQTLAFREVWEYFLRLRSSQNEQKEVEGVVIPADAELLQQLSANLPFTLTNGQKRVIWDCALELATGRCMTRLLNGDVGAGKTVVAGMLAALVAKAGKRTLVLAPTEILAEQHLKTLQRLLEPIGVSVGVRTASHKENEMADVVVGTHALLTEGNHQRDVALVVVDEQHRFGVRQRSLLREKAAIVPHVLSMTATPIPRTLALTVFAGLEVSFLHGRPAQRQAVETICVRTPADRESMYSRVEAEVRAGHQVFVVCPAITKREQAEGDSDSGEVQSLFAPASQQKKAVEEEVAVLAKRFPRARVAMVHGKLSGKEKTKIMAGFAAGELDILVATSVIEVGVDIPSATILVVEGAEFFGLAQLHQLRGRVGRGSLPGYCYLCPTNALAGAERLQSLVDSTDGFVIAEADLAQRGPGDLQGLAQSGLPDFKVASLTNLEFLVHVRDVLDDYSQQHPEYLHSDKVQVLLERQDAVYDSAMLE